MALLLRVPPLVECPPPSHWVDFVGQIPVEDFHGLLELGARAGAVDGGGQGEESLVGSGFAELADGRRIGVMALPDILRCVLA